MQKRKMAFLGAKKTRKSINTKLSEYLGGPRKFLQIEFPTLRDCLQQRLYLQRDKILIYEKSPRKLMQEIFRRLLTKLQNDGMFLKPSLKSP